ncbi:MAG: ribosome biogenesis GTPase Der [Gammaproteobacteria bacterium AqS3]|nr:ribosome biogenesis GTPase Der [Gammaproteobacteria bacterium AqS3]
MADDESLSTRPARVVIAGRPNVGKSTLFNRLSNTQRALIGSVPGVTRDLRSMLVDFDGTAVELIDSGGIERSAGLQGRISELAHSALASADIIVLVFDAREGLLRPDEEVIASVRRIDRPVLVAFNKIDGVASAALAELAVPPWPHQGICARTGRGVRQLRLRIGEMLTQLGAPSAEMLKERDRDPFTVSLLGRPNVGKSTLLNQLLGRERALTSSEAGTTVDEVEGLFEHAGRSYRLFDTAGVRRRTRIAGVAEEAGVVRSLNWLRGSDIGVLLIDAVEGMVEQDARLLGLIDACEHPCVLTINKWDRLDDARRQSLTRSLDRRARFARNIPRVQISALSGRGVPDLVQALDRLRTAHEQRGALSTALINRLLERAVAEHPPPGRGGGRQPRLRFAHSSSSGRIVVRGTRTADVDATYRRYLRGFFERALDLPRLEVELIEAHNPYAQRSSRSSRRKSKPA